MPIRMFKALYPNTKRTDQNNTIDKKEYNMHTVTHVYYKLDYARSTKLIKALNTDAVSL